MKARKHPWLGHGKIVGHFAMAEGRGAEGRLQGIGQTLGVRDGWPELRSVSDLDGMDEDGRADN